MKNIIYICKRNKYIYLRRDIKPVSELYGQKYYSAHIFNILSDLRHECSSESLGFRTLFSVRNSIWGKNTKFQKLGSVSVFRKTRALLRPLERANLNHWTLSKTFFPSYLECRTMDKANKSSDSECHTASSELFRFHVNVPPHTNFCRHFSVQNTHIYILVHTHTENKADVFSFNLTQFTGSNRYLILTPYSGPHGNTFGNDCFRGHSTKTNQQNKLRGLSQRSKYSDLVTAPPRPAKLVKTFADRGCREVGATDPYGRILGFLNRIRYFFFLSSSSSIILTRLTGPRSRPITSQKIW
jgi:hypothetical protein